MSCAHADPCTRSIRDASQILAHTDCHMREQAEGRTRRERASRECACFGRASKQPVLNQQWRCKCAQCAPIMLLMGMKMSFTKKPMKPMIAKPIEVACAIFENSAPTIMQRREQVAEIACSEHCIHEASLVERDAGAPAGHLCDQASCSAS